jgi:hypothetical protein
MPAADADAHHTQTWVLPHASRAARPELAADEVRAQLETSLQTVYARLRDTQDVLAAKHERERQLEDSLQEVRALLASAQQRAARDAGELAQLHAGHEELMAAAAKQRAELDAQQQAAQGAAAQRTTELEGELAKARELLDAAAVRATQLQQALDARDAAARARDSAALERRQALVVSERAHAGALRDLKAERERNALCLEALHRAESRRLIFQSVVSDLQHEVDERDASLTRLGHDLAARDARARELDAQLKRRAEPLPTPAAPDPTPPADLERLRAGHAELAAALEAARSGSAAALAAERKRAAALESELAGVRQEMADWGGVLQAAQRERGEHSTSTAAGDARVRDLARQLVQHQEAMRALQTECDTGVVRTRELEADLQAAEDTINRLESQARGSGARLEELEKANRQWRLTVEEARATSTDSAAANGALRAAAAPAGEPHAVHDTPAAGDAVREAVPEGATRLLIAKERGREIVHVLGRKTSVGRTPDNELQIDAKFISRHHAVILAGPVQTVIEDLNSTNGVLVNGQRITRQILKDGDDVVIGRSHYRFAVRHAGEKHSPATAV